MNSSMGKKVFAMFFLPFLTIFAVLSILTYTSISYYVDNLIQTEIKGVTEVNSTILGERIDSVRISVLTAAEILGTMDENTQSGRTQADSIIRSMFNNEFVFNAWLVFEPQAFDGRDDEHTMDYPGAPSGRFMRSYVIDNGEIIVAADMHEDMVDDPVEFFWYTRPMDTGSLYIDMDNEDITVWNYCVGEGDIYTLSVVMPIFRDGQAIGCVGADVLFSDMTISLNAEYESTVVVFYSSGRVFYAPDNSYTRESVETLEFTHIAQIRETFNKAEPLFLANEYCVFTDSRAFSFLQPVFVKDYDESFLFLYVSTPREILYQRLLPILAVIAVTTIAIVWIIMLLLSYVIRKISKPINQLTFAADAISQGNIETEIGYYSDADSEIGLLSQSLHRMVEQFRVHAMVMEQRQRESDMSMNIETFVILSDNTQDTFNGLSAMLCEYFKLFKTTIVHKNNGVATAYPHILPENSAFVIEKKAQPYEFKHNEQIEALLVGRKLVFLNKQAILSHNITWLEPQTNSACILPFAQDALHGFIVFESDNRAPMTEGMESNMMYVSLILDKWLSDWHHPKMTDLADVQVDSASVDSASVVSSPPMTIELLKQIDGLEIDSALAALGGMQEVYEKTIEITARLMPETIGKMDKYLSDDNFKDFAVEAHGVKGALRNVGAASWGNMASRLEDAALAGDADYCSGHYPAFKDSVTSFAKQVTAALSAKEAAMKESIDAASLSGILMKVKASAEVYNAMEALEFIKELTAFSYNEEADKLIENTKAALEEFNCEGALTNIKKLEEVFL